MVEFLVYGIFFIGMVLLTMCYISICLGKYIDSLSTPKSGGGTWFSKPSISTQIFSFVIMILFIVGGLMVIMSTDTVIRILGLVTMISAYMFEGTVLLFSGAVMSAIRNNGKVM